MRDIELWGALKIVLSNKGLRIKAKKCLYEGVIVPTTLYGAEAWGMRSAERRKVNVLEMKCLRSLVVYREWKLITIQLFGIKIFTTLIS